MPSRNGDRNKKEWIDYTDYTRRKLMGLAGVTLIGGTAGCLGDGDGGDGNGDDGTSDGNGDDGTGDDTTPGEGDPRDPVLDFFVTDINWAIEDTNTNHFGLNENFLHDHTRRLWNLRVARHFSGRLDGPEGQVLKPMLTDDSPRLVGDGCAVEVEIEDGFTWHDGTDVTIEDLWTGRKLDNYLETSGNIEEAEVPVELDGDTLILHYGSPMNQRVADLTMQDVMAGKQSYYGEWVERFDDASSESDRESVIEDFVELSISIQEFKDEGLGCGLYKPENWDDTQITSVIHEDHPFAERTNIEEIRAHVLGDDQVVLQSISEDQIDIGRDYYDWLGQLNNPPEDIELTGTSISPMGVAFKMNYSNEHLAKRRVRRAIAYWISHEEIQQIAQGSLGFEPPAPIYQTGNPDNETAELLHGQDWLEGNLIDYGTSSNEEMANQLMQDAGYEKDGDVWVDENGNATEGFELYPRPGGLQHTVAQLLADKLSQFGIQTDFVAVEPSNFWSRVRESGDFDFIIHDQGNSSVLPDRQYRISTLRGIAPYENIWHDQYEVTGEVEGCTREAEEIEFTRDRTAIMNHRLRPPLRVPPHGDDRIDEPSEDEEHWEWRPVEMNQRLQFVEEPELTEITRNFGWFCNWDMPMVTLYPRTATNWLDTQNFIEAEDALAISATFNIGTGRINGRTD